jgi:hypothetical protein
VKSTAIRITHWVEDILCKCDEFKLPGRKALKDDCRKNGVFVIDATESPIERPMAKSKKKLKNQRKN